jgi:heme oxygenase (mycobilin-producing)
MRWSSHKIAEGRAVLHTVLGETRAFDGCLGVKVIEDSTDPAHVVAIEQWESLEKDAAYREWRAGEGAATDGSAKQRATATAPPRIGTAICAVANWPADKTAATAPKMIVASVVATPNAEVRHARAATWAARSECAFGQVWSPPTRTTSGGGTRCGPAR